MANTVFIIYNTAGQPVAAIQPNTLNGPGGVQQTSDLSMFGLGYALWGQASDQNDYRLVENFACPQSVVNPIPLQPMSTEELGSGNGINVPLIGQLWFNTTNEKMYAYSSTGWNTVANNTVVVTSGAADPGVVGPLGQLFFNTLQNQLKISNGSIWEPTAVNYLPLSGGTMNGSFSMGNNQIHNLLNPSSAFDAATKQYVDTVASGSGVGIFVPLAGGTMTGTLNMSGSANISITSGQLTTGGNVTLTGGTLSINSGSGQVLNVNGGRIGGLSNTVGALTDAVNSNAGDIRWLNKTSVSTQTVTAPVAFTAAAPPTITNSPVNPTDAVNKAYVDANSGIPKFLTTPILVYDTPFFNTGTLQATNLNIGWTTFNAAGAGGIPANVKAVIVEGHYVGFHESDGSPATINNTGFILLRNNTTKGIGTYPSSDTFVLSRYNNNHYKYNNNTAGCNQGVFPVRLAVEGGHAIGSFDYSIPRPRAGSATDGGLGGATIRIIGYYA